MMRDVDKLTGLRNRYLLYKAQMEATNQLLSDYRKSNFAYDHLIVKQKMYKKRYWKYFNRYIKFRDQLLRKLNEQ